MRMTGLILVVRLTDKLGSTLAMKIGTLIEIGTPMPVITGESQTPITGPTRIKILILVLRINLTGLTQIGLGLMMRPSEKKTQMLLIPIRMQDKEVPMQ